MFLYVCDRARFGLRFDADSLTARLHFSLEDSAGSGETTSDIAAAAKSPRNWHHCDALIDRSRNAITVAMSKIPAALFFQRIHAHRLTTARIIRRPHERTATYPARGHSSRRKRRSFDPKQYKGAPRACCRSTHDLHHLASHCDARPYTSWVMAFQRGHPRANQPSEASHLTQRRRHWMAAPPRRPIPRQFVLIIGNGTLTPRSTPVVPGNGDGGNASSNFPLLLD